MALFLGLPEWASTRKVKPIWILLKQETVSGSGIIWAIFKSAPRSRQITTQASFLPGMPFLLPNQQRQSTEGTNYMHCTWTDHQSLLLCRLFTNYWRVFCEVCVTFIQQGWCTVLCIHTTYLSLALTAVQFLLTTTSLNHRSVFRYVAIYGFHH